MKILMLLNLYVPLLLWYCLSILPLAILKTLSIFPTHPIPVQLSASILATIQHTPRHGVTIADNSTNNGNTSTGNNHSYENDSTTESSTESMSDEVRKGKLTRQIIDTTTKRNGKSTPSSTNTSMNASINTSTNSNMYPSSPTANITPRRRSTRIKPTKP